MPRGAGASRLALLCALLLASAAMLAAWSLRLVPSPDAAGDEGTFGITPAAGPVPSYYKVFRTTVGATVSTARLIARVANSGGAGETVQDGRTGLVCTDDAPDTLASAILRLLDDPAWRTRVRADGPGLVDLHLIDREVLAQDRDVHRVARRLEVGDASAEVLGVGEHAHGGRAAGRVRPCRLRRIEVGRQLALGG